MFGRKKKKVKEAPMPKEHVQVNQKLYIFSEEGDLEKIMTALTESFGLAPMQGRNQLELSNEGMKLDIDVFTKKELGEEGEKFIDEQRNVCARFFQQIQEADNDIRINLALHIRSTLAFICINVELREAEDTSYVVPFLLDTIKKTGGVLLLDEGQTAIDSEGNLILDQNGKSELTYYFPFTFDEAPMFLEECTDVQKKRRNENMKELYDRRIYCCELPVNASDDEITLRTHEEIVKRAIGLLAISLYSEAQLNPDNMMSVPEAREFVERALRRFAIDKIEEVLSPKELTYYQDDNANEALKIKYSWAYENLYCLEWVLSLLDWTDPNNICDVGLTVRTINQFSSIQDMIDHTAMRSKKEILDKADMIYRMDWAAVDARMWRLAAPAGLDGGVTMERHKTLNWLIRFENADWDNVDTPT